MANSVNRQKVILTNICPCIDNGMYPAKAVVNEAILIAADIFTDGHEELEASVHLKHISDKKWTEFPMKFKQNDHWECAFTPEVTGYYTFKISAWINPFLYWQKSLQKKYLAGQPLTIELQIGADMIENAANSLTGKDKKSLMQFGADIANEEDLEKAVMIAANKELISLMSKANKTELTNSGVFRFEAERARAGFSTWYELFPRSASLEARKHGTFKDVQKLLPRIHEMGFDTLYLPPIHPIGTLKRKGKNNSLDVKPGEPGSPWAIGNSAGGHKSIHPELGTLADFRKLIKAAREHKIEIAMDIAFQCAPDHPYVKQHPQWFKWRPDGTVQYAENPPKRYEDILPFYFENEDWQNLWIELKSIFEFWINEGVSVFRIDNPHTKPFAFWKWVIAEIRALYPETIFLAEAFTRPRIMEQLAKCGFNQSYTYFAWRNTKQELQEYLTELTKTDMRYYFRPNFWPNTPDILTPELAAGGENMHIIRLILAATLSSSYGIYGPVYEFAVCDMVPGKQEYLDNEKYEIKHWNWHAETRVGEVITLVNKIRKENTALHTTYNIEFIDTDNDKIIAWFKQDKVNNNVLIIVVNLDPHRTQSAKLQLPLKELGIAYDKSFNVFDLLSHETYTWFGESSYVILNPNEMPAHILKPEYESYVYQE